MKEVISDAPRGKAASATADKADEAMAPVGTKSSDSSESSRTQPSEAADAAETTVLPTETTAAEQDATAADALAEGDATAPADEVDEGDEVDAEASAPVERKRSWLRIGGASFGAVLLIAALAVAAIFGWKLNNRNDVAEAGQQAEATARTYAVTLTTTDSKSLDKNFKDVLDGATGQFKDTYAKSSEELKQVLTDAQASGRGTVVDSGIKSASKDKVEVLLFIDQTVSNKQTPQPRVDRSRVVMTMEKVGGRWLASNVELP